MTQLTTRIVGAQHHEGAQTRLNTLRRGARVELRRDPGNRHDPNAVECWSTDGVFVGFIPMKDNPPVAAAMDRGDPVACEISPTQPMVRVSWPSVVSLAEGAAYRKVVRG